MQEVTESGKEFQIAGPVDLKPREPSNGADTWDTETLSTGRACAKEYRDE